MPNVGKMLIGAGVLLIVAGGAIMLLGRSGLALGRLPGDVMYRGKNTTVYFPIVTCVLLSVVLSLVMYVIQRLR